ncbi:hypothetical protein [Kitasatospora camelliae]|uniref:Antibiotic biosynthesis monooxygenase n=1 Tax=Kitasatospora camelliae TaxID=3156397 RepID=A0AAU8K438_9ACTN
MHLRTVYATGDPALIDSALDALTAEAPGLLAPQPGYQGFGLFADRELGKIVMGSWWETEEDQQASDLRLRDRRTALLGPFASSIATDVWEAAVYTPPARLGAGAGFRMLRFDFDPASAEQMITAARESVLPALRETPGFESFTLLVDRAAGRGSAGALHTDRAALVASRGPSAAVRAAGVPRTGVVIRSLEEFEAVLLHRPEG